MTSNLTEVTIDPVAAPPTSPPAPSGAPYWRRPRSTGWHPLLGSTTDVGAVGYTLGGGMGWLARRYGLASDSVVAFDLVTPDGIEVRASASEQPELFWALKGGGAGTFGVVTGMEIELYPVDHASTPATCCTRSRWPARSSPAGGSGSPMRPAS